MLRPRLTTVLYHNVADGPQRCVASLGVTTPVSVFEAHLDRYQRDFDIVDLSTVLSGRLPRRPLLLTFDDSYLSLATTVAPILARRGIPAVAFLNPDPIETTVPMLDHVLGELVSRFGTTAVQAVLGPEMAVTWGARDSLDAYFLQLTPAARLTQLQRLLTAFNLDMAELYGSFDIYLRPSDVATMVAAGIEIGNHTASHPRCRTLDPNDCQHEIADAKTRLERLAGHPIRAFSVPYGAPQDVTATIAATVRDSGHEILFLAYGRHAFYRANGSWRADRLPLDGVPLADLDRHLGFHPRVRMAKDTVRRLVGRTHVMA